MLLKNNIIRISTRFARSMYPTRLQTWLDYMWPWHIFSRSFGHFGQKNFTDWCIYNGKSKSVAHIWNKFPQNMHITGLQTWLNYGWPWPTLSRLFGNFERFGTVMWDEICRICFIKGFKFCLTRTTSQCLQIWGPHCW